MSKAEQKFTVKVGLGTLDRKMTRTQARRYGERNMPADLKAAGFDTVVFQSDEQIHGGVWLRVNYGMKCRAS